MPGAGKSTVGVLLAKRTGRDFVDTDLLIQRAARRPLQEIVDGGGREELLRLEEACVLELACERTVIATGGSVVYSPRAMRHLLGLGKIVFLDVPLAVLEQRIDDLSCRGLARRPGQTLADLYGERRPLYQRYAEQTVDCGARSHEAVLNDLLRAIR
jgi:shikimate kinase